MLSSEIFFFWLVSHYWNSFVFLCVAEFILMLFNISLYKYIVIYLLILSPVSEHSRHLVVSSLLLSCIALLMDILINAFYGKCGSISLGSIHKVELQAKRECQPVFQYVWVSNVFEIMLIYNLFDTWHYQTFTFCQLNCCKIYFLMVLFYNFLCFLIL